MDFLISKYNYIVYIVLMMIGFYAIMAKKNLIKKIIGINIFQTAVFLFFISIGYVQGGTAPILWEGEKNFINPLPSVLILTAIVVCVSTTAVALSIIIRIYQEFNSIEEDEIISSE